MGAVILAQAPEGSLTPPVKPTINTCVTKVRPKKPTVKMVVKKHRKKASFMVINVAMNGAPASSVDSAHQVFVDSPTRYEFSLFFIHLR
jgi:hypothetical protein